MNPIISSADSGMVAPTVPAKQRSWWSKLKPTRQERVAVLFVSPLLVFLVIFLLIPSVTALSRAFQNWSLGDISENRWIGFGNYAMMVQETRFWNSVRVTLTFAIGMVVIPYSIALPLALFMNAAMRGREFFRTIFFLPVVTPISASALVFRYLFNTDYGLVNELLQGLGAQPVSWLGRPATAIATSLIFIIWGSAGFNAVTLLAGLQVVTKDILEAATMDGASGWSLFRHITFPMLKPTTVVVLAFGLIGAFKMFGEIYTLTMGGPALATEVLGMYLYTNAFQYWRLGYASAISSLILIVSLVVNIIMARVGRVDWQ
ncbi:MAG: carbohydrate ABC transporter permease [Anaerolineae bacterium]